MASLSDQVGSTENKHLLWSLLSEENIFADLRDDAVTLVMNIFETAINTTSNACMHITHGHHNRANALAEMNKDVIQRVIADVSKYKASVVAPPQKHVQTVPTMMYKSADLQEARVKDITSKLKIHEADMNSFLVLKKPAEINFADDASKDDRPIGDEMEQLIQAALASRARELEILQQPQPQPQPQSAMESQKKNVSFATEQFLTDATDTTTAEMEIGTLFGKLKRSPPQPQPQPQQQQQQQQPNNSSEISESNGSSGLFNNFSATTPTAMDVMNDIYKLLVSVRAEIQDLRGSVKLIAEKRTPTPTPNQSSLSDSVSSSE